MKFSLIFLLKDAQTNTGNTANAASKPIRLPDQEGGGYYKGGQFLTPPVSTGIANNSHPRLREPS
jgi:hypothetical protein